MSFMKNRSLALSALFALSLASQGLPTRARASTVENPLFGYTHLLPSPFTLPAGRLQLGTQIALGVTDFLQVGTDLLRDIYQVYNANAKLGVLDFPEFALGLNLGWETYNLNDFDARNPNLQITSWQPGAVAGFETIPHVALFFGGNLNLTSTNLVTNGIETSGYVRGAQIESDISWAYNPKKKSLGNVLSGGVSYDLTYKIAGFGVSHHWRGWHVGIHYYPNASRYKVMPILAGGTSIDF
jgi:hypothetical protein